MVFDDLTAAAGETPLLPLEEGNLSPSVMSSGDGLVVTRAGLGEDATASTSLRMEQAQTEMQLRQLQDRVETLSCEFLTVAFQRFAAEKANISMLRQ